MQYFEACFCGGGAAEEEWMGKPGLSATVRLLRMAFFRKVITRHDTGLGEAYMDGDFEVFSNPKP